MKTIKVLSEKKFKSKLEEHRPDYRTRYEVSKDSPSRADMSGTVVERFETDDCIYLHYSRGCGE